MPQISPMNWLMLMLTFIFIFYLVSMKVYYMK